MPKQTVLVGEHEAATRKSIIDALDKEIYQPVIAFDSDQVLDLLKEEKIHFIIMNLFLPGQSGMKTIAQIRALEGYDDASALLIVIAPANRRADLSRAVDSGASDYETKPLEVKELIQTLDKFRKKLPPPPEPEQPA